MRRIGMSILILLLGLTACSAPPSNAVPISTQAISQPATPAQTSTQPASPTAGAGVPLTGGATQTQPLSQAPTLPPMPTQSPAGAQPATQTAALPPTPAQTPTAGPAFDITKRVGQPPIDNSADYLQWMLANTPENKDYILGKWPRLQAIMAIKDATDPRVLAAFLRTPREDFFDASSPAQAYASAVYSIGYGQTISGPHLVAHMTQAIDPQPNQKVLEIGTGSGYQSAVLSELSNYVYTIEIVPQLAQQADAKYTNLSKGYPEYANIKRKNADGYYGWQEFAPFDRIIVTAGIDHVPPPLLAQLAPNGIMVIPVGPPSGQTVLKITKVVNPDGSITFTREDIYHGRKILFVPFTGVPNGH